MSKRWKPKGAAGASPPPAAEPARPAYESPEDEANRALSGIPLLQKIEDLPEGECWVICRTMMAPVYRSFPVTQTVTLTDKPQTLTFPISTDAPIAAVFQPPNGTVSYCFSEADERRSYHAMFLGAKRVRNAIAFVSGTPMPMVYAFASRKILFRMAFRISEIMRYHPEVNDPDPENVKRWYGLLEKAYPTAERLLRNVEPMSPLGRAVSLVGDAVWTDDLEEAFLYAWRAIDVIAKLDYSAARRLEEPERSAAIAAYSAHAGDRHAETSCCRGPGDLRKILVSLSRRAPEFAPDRVKELHKLRGTVAHDTVDVDQFSRVLDARSEVVMMARNVVLAAVGLPAGGASEATSDE